MDEEPTAGEEGAQGPEVVQIIMQEDGQAIMPEGQFIQLNTEDGMQYIQLTTDDGENQLVQIGPDGQGHLVQVVSGEDGSLMTIEPGDPLVEQGEGEAIAMETNEEKEDGAAESDARAQVHVLGLSELATNDGEPQEEEMDMSEVKDEPDWQETVTHPVAELEEPAETPKPTIEETEISTETDQGQPATDAAQEETVTEAPAKQPKEKPAKVLDLKKPIELTSETVVMVDGKKCVLRVDPVTSHLVAYPVKPEPGKRPRGRPRKVRDELTDGSASALSPGVSRKVTMAEMDEADALGRALSEQENSAAEGLLGLSDVDGRRKSLRLKRKPKTLGEYETGAIEGVEDETVDDGQIDPEGGILSAVPVTPTQTINLPANLLTGGASSTPVLGVSGSPLKRGRGRPPKFNLTTNRVQNFLANLGLPVKRGRGRPRRNPPPGGLMPGPIPAFIIPSPGGQAVMMAPVQGLNMKDLQKPQLANLLPKPEPPPPVETGPPTSIIIENEDGSQTHIMTSHPGLLAGGEGGTELADGTQVLLEEQQEFESEPILEGEEEEDEDEEEEEADQQVDTIEDAAAAAAAAVEQGLEGEPPGIVVRAEPQMITIAPSGAISIGPGGQLSSQLVVNDGEITEVTTNDKENVPTSSTSTTSSSPEKDGNSVPPAAIIQLPQHLIPLLMPKKDPVKIGLKATEKELEKLKCPKCDFQAYYEKQFQTHIASHGTDIHKCKCCHFVSFDEEGLLEHFKDVHPKCICLVCNFMAEHAYVIKRHMMRHDPKGCECELCGKSYKDQYILKMHIKMVHMPAEVLFECTVCSKKFTRKAHLKRHMRIHEPEKPFKCPHCDYRGCEKSDITKHLLIHEEPRHVCEVCGKAFRHIKNKELHVKRHKGQRDYKCGVCDFYGYTFTDIRKHIERKHSDSKTIICDKCGAAFRTDAAMREHQLKQCEVMLIEQALAAGEEPTMIQLPPGTQLGGHDGHQLLTVDGSHVNITVEHVALPDDSVCVDLDGAQITETEMSEGHLVERAIVEHQLVEQPGDHHISISQAQEDMEQVQQLHLVGEEEEVELSGVELVEQDDGVRLVQVDVGSPEEEQEQEQEEMIITMTE